MKDSIWDILLELFVNGEEGGIVYVKQLILACGIPPASAMRLIDRLEDGNLLSRVPDPLDHRRVIVSLSEHARSAMMAMLRKMSAQHDEEEVQSRPAAFVARRQ